MTDLLHRVHDAKNLCVALLLSTRDRNWILSEKKGDERDEESASLQANDPPSVHPHHGACQLTEKMQLN